MKLRSAHHTVKAILKKTRAEFFKDIEVGDTLQVVMVLDTKARGGSGLYATRLAISNVRKKTSVTKSQTEMAKLLANFELYEEVLHWRRGN